MMRNYSIDNIKISMMIFVVFGHLLEPLVDIPVVKAIWVWIYLFHMPVFVMIAGLYSKPNYTPDFLVKQVRGIAVPFLAFTFLYEVVHFFLVGQVSNYAINFQPYWLLWFLASLLLWRVSLPYVLKMKFSIAIMIAVSLAAGYVDSVGRFAGVSRTLYFFPFFIFGNIFLARFMQFVKTNKNIRYGLFAGLLVSGFIAASLQGVSWKWLSGSHSYESSGLMTPYAGLYRLATYGLSFSLSLIIIGLMPSRQYRVTARGQNSLYIYLWHGFFVKVLIATGIFSLIGGLSIYAVLLLLLVVALALVFVLSQNFVKLGSEKYLFSPLRKPLG